MLLAKYFKKPFDYLFREDKKQIHLMFRADKANRNIQDLDIEHLLNTIDSYSSCLLFYTNGKSNIRKPLE